MTGLGVIQTIVFKTAWIDYQAVLFIDNAFGILLNNGQ